jgi:heme/copper-type cytochrome/quinol oxidase subunit 3
MKGELLDHPSDGRSIAWSGVAVLVAIEGTAIASMIASYFFLRFHTVVWPPGGVMPSLAVATFGELLLLASVVPIRFASARAIAGFPNVRGPLAIGALLVAASVAAKIADLRALPHRWSANAYGSMTWTLSGYAAFHAVAVLLALVALVVFASRPCPESRGDARGRRAPAAVRAGVPAVALYATFAALSSFAIYVTEYLTPRWW